MVRRTTDRSFEGLTYPGYRLCVNGLSLQYLNRVGVRVSLFIGLKACCVTEWRASLHTYVWCFTLDGILGVSMNYH